MAIVLPQFPVGVVHMPHMPVELRVFEPRYLNLMGDLMTAERPVFGIPLLDQQVPDGQAPESLTVGTLVRVDDFGMTDDFMGITATATRRYVVTKWLEASPYPRAEVEYLPELVWDDQFDSQRMQVELEVRSLISRASKYGQMQWEADTEVSIDSVESIWQLAGMLPVPDEDLYPLLCAETLQELIDRTLAVCVGGNTFLDDFEAGSTPT